MPPRNGKIRNGGQRHGLWSWPSGSVAELEPGEALDNPRTRGCPTCKALPTRACRRRVRGGHVELTGYHPARRRA